MALVTTLIAFGLAACVSAIPFIYYDLASTDPEYANVVEKFKTLLKKEGIIDPSDIKEFSRIQEKNEIYRTSYQADFYTTSGKECHYKWRAVKYSLTQIADHSCTEIPRVLPSRKKTPARTTTEEPTTTDELPTTEDPVES